VKVTHSGIVEHGELYDRESKWLSQRGLKNLLKCGKREWRNGEHKL